MNPTAPAPTTPPAVGVPPAPAITPQNVSAPTPQYDTAGALDAIRNYYKIPQETAAAVGQQKANAYNAQTAFENNRANMQFQATVLQDKLNPSKYQIHNDNTGTHIIDPTGKEVDIGTYVNTTGENPAKVLANSTNPADQQFVQDYNNYETFMQAALTKNNNKESEAVYNDFVSANPGLDALTPSEARQAFLDKYSSYFGVPSKNSSYTRGFTPAYDPAAAKYAYQRSPGGPLYSPLTATSAPGSSGTSTATPSISSLAPGN